MGIQRLLFGFTAAAVLTLLFSLVTPLRAAAVQALAIVTCASTSACTGGNNTSTGPGVQGTSAKGKGVVGQTKSNSTTSANGQNGILGQDLSTAGSFDTGVAGTSTRGTGVFARSGSGNGVTAQSTSGSAVQATSSTGNGLIGVSSAGTGAFGIGITGVEGSDAGGASNDALLANGHGGNLIRANNATGTDVLLLKNDGSATITGDVTAGSLTGGSNSTFQGVHGLGSGIGVFGEGQTGMQGIGSSIGVTGGGPVGVEGDNQSVAGSIAVKAQGSGGLLFVGHSVHGSDTFSVDDGGNVHAHSFTADLAATQTTSNGSRLTTYSPESRAPTIEDFGEATLAGGQAYVRLDSTFASGMDRRHPYLVFITPQGAVSGTLYVTQKSASGFAVREATATLSNVAFDYRIVARPYAKPAFPSSASRRTKAMRPMRKSVTIPRTHPQSKTVPIH